jgi:hypothetical protein
MAQKDRFVTSGYRSASFFTASLWMKQSFESTIAVTVRRRTSAFAASSSIGVCVRNALLF